MIGYLDSSVLLRILLNQPGALPEFAQLERPVASKVLRTECLRSLDRFRKASLLSEDEHLTALKELYESLDSVEWIELSDRVLELAGSSFSVAMGTLDAIHLSSAILWRQEVSQNLIFLTHDAILQKAAISVGFTVLG